MARQTIPHIEWRKKSQQMPFRDQRAAVREAFQAWARHINMDFAEIRNNRQSDVQIQFASGSHGTFIKL